MRTVIQFLLVIQIYVVILIYSTNSLSINNKTDENEDEIHVQDMDYEDSQEETQRTSRFLLFRNSPLYSIVKQTPAYNYRPQDETDIFDFLRDEYKLPEGLKTPLKEYDFIIVGAGSAGCVLASRLSENPNWSVLLLEVGKAESLLTDVPISAANLQFTHFNWGYTAEKAEGTCLGMEGQKCHWPRGKAVGGSSVINYMIYSRGRKQDWDRIAEAGNPGWSYKEVLPYFLKSERSNLHGRENSTYHNRNGLLSVEDVPFRTYLLHAFIDAGLELGQKVVDYNKPNKMGFGTLQATIRDGKRHSVAKAFLYPFRHRENLHILPNTKVTKINIDPITKTAISVEYIRNKVWNKVKAKKEIILSAGTFSSPQLLMLSGVGPKNHLKELDIPVIQNLPVGENMYDHIGYPGLVFLINETGKSLIERNEISLSNYMKWLRNGEGSFTVPGGVEGLGFIKTKISEETINFPDVELIFAAGGFNIEGSQTVRRGYRITDQFFNTVYGDILEKESWTIAPMLLTPKSKGYVKLRDKNPFHYPKLYNDHFSDERDLLTLVEGIKYIIKLSKTKAFQKYGSRLHDKHFPNCCTYEFDTDEYWICAARTLATTLHHQIGTCKMGPINDPEAVVDNELRVYGIKSLRVADASIIPKPITAHSNAPGVMIGEKLADILKTQWQ